MQASDWDERYRHHTHRTSGDQPNEVLVTEIGGQTPGSALEIGCGEGTDAIWLAANGWRVTAIDISQVALDRAAAVAGERGVSVEWVCAAFGDTPVEPAASDLVFSLYPALRHDPDGSVIGSLIDTVAPGGTLLFVGHAALDPEDPRSQGFDPADYIQPADVAARLDDDWRIVVDETRARTGVTSHGPPHSLDTILKAYRLP